MNVERFFADVEARVGLPPAVDPERPDYRPPIWFNPNDDGANPLVPSERVELLPLGDVDDGGSEWPVDEAEPSWWDWRVPEDDWVDAIARYKPWHAFRSAWGIEINNHYLDLFVEAIADECGAAPGRLAPFVLRQVLAHEYVHFSFEVAATEIEDLFGEPRYLRYLTQRFGWPNRWSSGPLEEVVATWAEAQYVDGLPTRGRGCAPRGYRAAVRAVNQAGPPGYCDFSLMEVPAQGDRIVADVAGLIAGRDVWSPLWWPRVIADDEVQVPLYWRGTAERLAAYGLGKELRAPSIRAFEHWLYSTVGARRLKGTKHAKAELPNGRRVTYKDDGKQLLPPEAQQIAQKAGLRNRRELHEYVMHDRVPEALLAQAA
jgi:hypothetical protein